MWSEVKLVGKDTCNLGTSKSFHRWEGREKTHTLFQLGPRPSCSTGLYYCLLLFSNIYCKISAIWLKDLSTTFSAGNQSTRCTETLIMPIWPGSGWALKKHLKSCSPLQGAASNPRCQGTPSSTCKPWPIVVSAWRGAFGPSVSKKLKYRPWHLGGRSLCIKQSRSRRWSGKKTTVTWSHRGNVSAASTSEQGTSFSTRI